MNLTWRGLNDVITTMSEAELKAELERELANGRRQMILTRLHQRYCVLRADRERLTLLAAAQNPDLKVKL